MQTARNTLRNFLTQREKQRNRVRRLPSAVDLASSCAVSIASLRCGACMEIFRGTPQILTCGHSFCDECLKKLERGNRGINPSRQAGCPVCGKKTLGEPTIDNFTMQSVLDSVNMMPEYEESLGRSQYEQLNSVNETLRMKTHEQAEKIKNMRFQLYFMYFVVLFLGLSHFLSVMHRYSVGNAKS